ncbi:MAG: pectinesterase family protein [Chitinophagaceae bacterium]
MKILFIYLALLISYPSIAQRRIVVAQDGSGDFTTIQAAFDKVPRNNKKPVTIYIKKGIYKEKLHLDSTKDFVYITGEDKFNTVLTYDDHTGKIAPSGDVINTRTSWSFLVMANNFSATNLSFENNAGFTAGQAVAVEVRGDKAIFNNCRFLGNQDVLFTSADNSRQYYKQCYIEGSTDFIFGSSTAWFEKCHIHSKKNSHITAASTPQEHAFGYVFNECVFTADTAFARVSLGRPWRPYASITYLHCYLDRHILPQGWDNWKNTANESTARYAEYKSYGPGANPSARFTWTRQLTAEQAKAITLQNVLRGWNPESQ